MLCARSEAKVPRLMGSSFSRPRGRFQRGSVGYRRGFGDGGRGARGLFHGSTAGSFGSTPGFGGNRGMSSFGASQGPRSLGFDSNGRGFGNWRGGSSFGSGNWSGSTSGMFGSTDGSMAGSARGRGFYSS